MDFDEAAEVRRDGNAGGGTDHHGAGLDEAARRLANNRYGEWLDNDVLCGAMFNPPQFMSNNPCISGAGSLQSSGPRSQFESQTWEWGRQTRGSSSRQQPRSIWSTPSGSRGRKTSGGRR